MPEHKKSQLQNPPTLTLPENYSKKYDFCLSEMLGQIKG